MTMTPQEALAVERPAIEVGQSYEFYCEVQQDYMPARERLRRFTGQKVTVIAAEHKPDDPTWEDGFSERTFRVAACGGYVFIANEAELNGWDRDLGQYFWPDATYGPEHDTAFLVNEH